MDKFDGEVRNPISMNQSPIVVRSPSVASFHDGGFSGSIGDPHAIWPFLAILARRRWLAVGILVFTLVLVAALTIVAPKVYTTHLELLTGGSGNVDSSQSAQTSLPVLNALLAASNAQSSETFVEMLRETPALTRTIDKLHLSVSPNELLGHVFARPVTNTSIVDLAITWDDPNQSARIANGLAESIVALRRQLVTRQADAVIAELNAQLEPAGNAMHDAADRLAQYQARIGIADAATQTQTTLQAAAALEQKAAQAQVDSQQAAASLRVVEAELARTPPSIAAGGSSQPNPIAAQLRTQLAQVDVQLQTALRQYTDQHPTVVALREQQQQLRAELAKQPATIVATRNTMANPAAQQLTQARATLRAQIAAAQAQLTTVRAQRAVLETKIRTLPAQTRVLADLDRRAKQTEFVYAAMSRKLSDATIARTTALADVTVVAPASAKDASVSPNLFFNLVIGAIVGLVIAVMGALVVDFLDGSVRTEDDVEERMALPVLTTVPALGTRKKPPAPWVRQILVESIHHLVTSLRYASSTPLKTVAFTSAAPGEGKSTVALATAIEYAAMNPRALIIDADLRRPTLHHKLGIEKGFGLSDALVGTASFDEVVRTTKYAGLDAVTSGTATANPAGLLQSNAFEAFLAAARSAYTMVIVDATACGPVTDATLVCTKVDGSIFVVASNETDVRFALKAIRRLQASGVRNVLGAVLNKAETRKSDIGAYGILADDGSRSLPVPTARDA